jgi:AcrR family transcriptional regulator
MGSKERKARDKEALRNLIMDNAIDLMQQFGIQNFTLRKLAEAIEYSPAALYEYFESKDALIDALSRKVCDELILGLKHISTEQTPEHYFLSLMRFHLDFLLQKKVRVELMNIIFFGSDSSRIPQSLLQAIDLFSNSLKHMNYPGLQSHREIEEALDVLRTFLCGLLKIIESQTVGLKRCQQILENGMQLMLQAWSRENA